MSAAQSNPSMDRKTKAALLKRLRAERAELVKGAQEIYKAHRKQRKLVRDALKEGPRTVPAIAEATGLSTELVLWHVTAMRKYGLVAEAEQDGDWPSYRLLPKKA